MNHQKENSVSNFGFWLYLMTDAVLFGSFFAVFAVMRNSTYGGRSGADLFDLKFVLIESILLLTSSFVCGLALLSAKQQNYKQTVSLLAVTGLLGFAFLCMEYSEFSLLIIDGDSWQTSGFLTSFFGLVGLHGLHIVVGIIWLAVLIALIIRRGLIESTLKRFELFSIYWHFLDIIWIFIFTFVYGMGVVG